MIHCSQSSWALLFIVRGPKSHCCWQNCQALSAMNAGPTGTIAVSDVVTFFREPQAAKPQTIQAIQMYFNRFLIFTSYYFVRLTSP